MQFDIFKFMQKVRKTYTNKQLKELFDRSPITIEQLKNIDKKSYYYVLWRLKGNRPKKTKYVKTYLNKYGKAVLPK